MTQSAIAASTAVPATVQPTTAAPIPFRTDPPVTATSALSVFLTALVLLAVTAVVLMWLRRRWAHLFPGRITPAGSGPRLEVLKSVRLSVAARAHVVDCAGERFLVVESARGIAIEAVGSGESARDESRHG